MENIGIIKVSGRFWENRKARRAIKKYVKVLYSEWDLYNDILVIKAMSKYFTVTTGEGQKYAQYEMFFKQYFKKFLFWKYSEIVLDRVEIVL